MANSTVIINAVSYQGNNVVVKNNKVFIDGKEQTPQDSKQISIVVNGGLDQLTIDSCESLQINGNVGSVKCTSGDISIDGYVSGNVQTVNGNIDCGNISGSVSTVNGSIKHRK